MSQGFITITFNGERIRRVVVSDEIRTIRTGISIKRRFIFGAREFLSFLLYISFINII